jgi:hypothetical protein
MVVIVQLQHLFAVIKPLDRYAVDRATNRRIVARYRPSNKIFCFHSNHLNFSDIRNPNTPPGVQWARKEPHPGTDSDIFRPIAIGEIDPMMISGIVARYILEQMVAGCSLAGIGGF